jgi:histidinol dehydrogenase
MKRENSVSEQVKAILERVAREGDRALEHYALKFDRKKISAKSFEVPKREWAAAWKRVRPEVRSAISEARRRIEFFHRQELKRITRSWRVSLDGVSVGQKVDALSSVGAYVPGGRFCYPSTVLMTCVPAKVAGVGQVVIVTPPQNLRDEILAAAHLAGADRLFGVGGPAAVAALAFGTRTLPKVQKIVGPGNQFVTEAKRQLFGRVGIDGLAGPSEVAVWADASADPVKVALNLAAQAEHDPLARSFLLSRDRAVLERVRKVLPKPFIGQVEFRLKKNDAEIAGDINAVAPEHLILAVRNPSQALKLVRCAGAVFLGAQTPVPLGDYTAGPSHVLPTGSSAQFASGLSVRDFLRWSSVIEARLPAARKAFRAARVLAETEGLSYHAKSLGER